ncbi:28249_t:CDS:2, partial [Racocetra persica]
DEREQATALYIYGKCQCMFGIMPQFANPMTSPFAFAPNLFGGVNRNQVGNAMYNNYNGIEYNKEQQQKLTKLKIDRYIELTYITINHTTLGYLSLGSKPKLQCTNVIGNKRLIFCDSVIKNQVERLAHWIQDPKVINIDDLKLEFKKIEEEDLDYQFDITKSSLDENDQLWLESLIEAHKEILQNNSAYACKQLEKCKKKLTEVLTDEEIQYILGKKVEINELETHLNYIVK